MRNKTPVTLNPGFNDLSVGEKKNNNNNNKKTTKNLKWRLNRFYYSKPQDA